MSQKDRQRWNSRYRQKRHPPSVRPIVQRFSHLAAKNGRALDLAAGLGVNALYLARMGFSVTAADISDTAMLRLGGNHPNLHPVCLDLDTWDIPRNYFDLIINIRFLNRRLFPQIIGGLRPGGLFIGETYLINDPYARSKSPFHHDYFLYPNELLHAFLSLRLIYYREDLNIEEEEKRSIAGLVGFKK